MLCDLTGICVDPHDLKTFVVTLGGFIAFILAVTAIALGSSPRGS